MSDQLESAGVRSTYLLDGRRVTISDLIEGDLLAVGSSLRFRRPRKGQTHSAAVTESGAIVLDRGQEFRSPSRAAAVAADVRAMDGWHAWTVASSGRSLDSLREELLDQVATGSADEARDGAEGRVPDPQRRYERLKEARSRADSQAPVEITVRDLMALWGVRARGRRINQRIEADLANHGLTTSPSFRKVTMDAAIHLITAAQEVETTGVAPSDIDEGGDLDVGLTVGNLPSALVRQPHLAL